MAAEVVAVLEELAVDQAVARAAFAVLAAAAEVVLEMVLEMALAAVVAMMAAQVAAAEMMVHRENCRILPFLWNIRNKTTLVFFHGGK